MSVSRYVRRILALITISLAGAVSLLFMASPASANIPPEPSGAEPFVVVPIERVVKTDDGVEWGIVAIIALAAALLAAAATEFFDNYRARHHAFG